MTEDSMIINGDKKTIEEWRALYIKLHAIFGNGNTYYPYYPIYPYTGPTWTSVYSGDSTVTGNKEE